VPADQDAMRWAGRGEEGSSCPSACGSVGCVFGGTDPTHPKRAARRVLRRPEGRVEAGFSQGSVDFLLLWRQTGG